MKKLLFAIMVVAMAIVSCDKEGAPVNVLEGQWITEEMSADGDFPANRTLMDIGAKSGAGKLTIAILMTESNAVFTEGDIVKISGGAYTYDVSKGQLTLDGTSVKVTFLSKNMIKLTEDGVELVFSRVDKQYSLSDMKDPEDFFLPEEFKLTPLKDADWAGGTIAFAANREVVDLDFAVSTTGLTEDNRCTTSCSLEDMSVTLGLFKDAEGNIADCDILVTATDSEGNEAHYTITSDAWRPVVYTKYNGEYTEDDLSQGWTRGAECWLGAVSTMDEIAYDGTVDTFGGISYGVPDFMDAFGTNVTKIGFDTPNTNQTGTITYTYGALTYELEIEICR